MITFIIVGTAILLITALIAKSKKLGPELYLERLGEYSGYVATGSIMVVLGFTLIGFYYQDSICCKAKSKPVTTTPTTTNAPTTTTTITAPK
jgi:hypothetical protein